MVNPTPRPALLPAARWRRPALLATAAVLAAPTGAGATAITFRDGNDAWIADATGAQSRQVTTDGTAARPWTHPSADAAGTVYAVRAPAAGGTEPDLRISPLAGSAVTKTLGWDRPSSAAAGPTGAEVSADGKQLVLTYGYRYDDGSTTGALAVFDPLSPSFPSLIKGNIAQATFWGTKVLFAADFDQGHGPVYAELTRPSFGTFLDGTSGIASIRLSRNAKTAVVVEGDGLVDILQMGGQAPPQTAVTGNCQLPLPKDRYDGRAHLAVSADGQQIAWSDAGGVHVATIPATIGNAAPCVLRNEHVISATGGQPQFTEGPAAVAPPPPVGGTTPQPGGAPLGGATIPAAVSPPTTVATPTPSATNAPSNAAGLRFTLARKGLRAALRSGGFSVAVTGAASGPITLTARQGERLVGSGKATVKRSGRASVRIRFSASARRRLAGAKRLDLSITAGSTTTSITLRG